MDSFALSLHFDSDNRIKKLEAELEKEKNKRVELEINFTQNVVQIINGMVKEVETMEKERKSHLQKINDLSIMTKTLKIDVPSAMLFTEAAQKPDHFMYSPESPTAKDSASIICDCDNLNPTPSETIKTESNMCASFVYLVNEAPIETSSQENTEDSDFVICK